MNSPIEDDLAKFYSSHGIAVSHFECASQKACDDATSTIGRTLHHGSEAHVGSGYGEPFGIVVVSLSEKNDSSELSDREDTEMGLSGNWKDLNPHLNGTLAILGSVLAPEITGREVFRHFALTRAAKCCLSGSADKPPDLCFWNCRQFVIPELGILKPRLVITQGRESRWAVDAHKAIPDASLTMLLDSAGSLPAQLKSLLEGVVGEYFRVLSLPPAHPAILLQLVHPADRGGRWALMERLNFPGLLGWIAKRLVQEL
jgi:hypothetical protein